MLQTDNLTENKITEKGTDEICKVLQDSSSLQILDLSGLSNSMNCIQKIEYVIEKCVISS